MKKTFVILLLVLLSLSVYAVPFYVRVNGTTDYLASATGATDYQGRTQYMASCVALSTGDVITFYDSQSKSEWAITELDPYGAYASFSPNTAGIVCNAAGNYDIYMKLAYQDDVIYIGNSDAGCTGAEPVDPENPGEVYTSSAPSQYAGVMLQGFYWDSYEDKGYGNTKWNTLIKQADEIGSWFDLVWLPPSAASSGGTGYLPTKYSNQNSAWGTTTNLKTLIGTLHANGARVVADIVVNHVNSANGWCSLASLNFGDYGSFTPDMSWICSTDEAFTGGHCSGTTGAADDGYGSEANYEAGRDWDHQQSQVRDMIKAYLKWLRADVGYDGFRYDYCKGFHTSHINDYNAASGAFFSVMEYWDGNPATLDARLSDAGYNTCTFDFGTKYTALNDGIAAGNYGGCKGAGLLGYGKARYAVTFVDSHDSFQRDGNEFCGAGNSMKNKDKLMQANAYILCMPGTPCVFYPHWVTFKEDIKKVINARYKTGVHNESAVSDEAGSGYYKAYVTGTNGTLCLLLGPNSGYGSAPSGYTLAAKGDGWGVYYKLNAARGDKDTNRTPIGGTSDLSVTESVHSDAVKVMENGTFYILRDGVRYDALGQRVK